MNTTKITAQGLYDRREEYAEIDGNDLHKLFDAVTGDPSPAGRTIIDAEARAEYAEQSRLLDGRPSDVTTFALAFLR